MDQPQDNLQRRQWLGRVGRGAALGGISVLTLGLLSKNGSCIHLISPCDACVLFGGCELPKAVETEARHANQENSKNEFEDRESNVPRVPQGANPSEHSKQLSSIHSNRAEKSEARS